MTVYEMIQKLAKYAPDLKVEVNAYKNWYSTMAEVTEDCKDGDATIVEFYLNQNTSDIEVSKESKGWGNNSSQYVRILAEL